MDKRNGFELYLGVLDVCLCWVVVVWVGRVVVVCLPRPMEGMGRLQFLDLFTELLVPPQVAGVGTIYCVFKGWGVASVGVWKGGGWCYVFVS